MREGYIQVYTGDGKGKTTAVLGLSLRAVGAGHHVFIGQFAKGGDYSELKAIPLLGGMVDLEQFGSGQFIFGEPTDEDRALAQAGLAKVGEALRSGRYQLVVLDEANIAVHYNLFSVEDLMAVLNQRAPGVEAIVTGRRAHPKLIEFADLVTEMREIKHYYSQGVEARRGIES
jgi:cob(I)alamin adenosyltransferase